LSNTRTRERHECRATSRAQGEQIVPPLHIPTLLALSDRLGAGETERAVEGGDLGDRAAPGEGAQLEPAPRPLPMPFDERRSHFADPTSGGVSERQVQGPRFRRQPRHGRKSATGPRQSSALARALSDDPAIPRR
jgi:hypothetical protein